MPTKNDRGVANIQKKTVLAVRKCRWFLLDYGIVQKHPYYSSTPAVSTSTVNRHVTITRSMKPTALPRFLTVCFVCRFGSSLLRSHAMLCDRRCNTPKWQRHFPCLSTGVSSMAFCTSEEFWLLHYTVDEESCGTRMACHRV
jgi:hypothetical protein